MSKKLTTCIIACAGDGIRWSNYHSVPKHLVSIEGEALLDRLVKQLSVKLKNDIYIVVKENDDRYHFDRAVLYKANLNPNNFGADKFLSSEALWNSDGRTILFFGDVWFSNKAINTIMDYPGKEWLVFGRGGPSKITGKPYGEIFAQSFYQDSIPKHKKKLNYIIDTYKQGKINRCIGWEHYRAMIGVPLNEHKVLNSFYEIDDWTEDFDSPKDYDTWIKRRCDAYPNTND